MAKVFSAVTIMIAAVFVLAPAASAGAPDAECNIYSTPVVSADSPVNPGDSIAVQGSGFPPGADVSISINGTAAGSAVAGAGGSFSTTVTVPDGTPAGSATVTAHSAECDETATTTTEVLGESGTTPVEPAPVVVDNAGATTQVAGATQSSGAALATTGSESGPLIAIAVALTGLGTMLLFAVRRRTSDAS